MQEIVALSGAHTLGRSRPERSGWGKPETKYTVPNYFLFIHCCSILIIRQTQLAIKNSEAAGIVVRMYSSMVTIG